MRHTRKLHNLKNKWAEILGGALFMGLGMVLLNTFGPKLFEYFALICLPFATLAFLYFSFETGRFKPFYVKASVYGMTIGVLFLLFASMHFWRLVTEPPFATEAQIQKAIEQCPNLTNSLRMRPLTIWNLETAQLLRCTYNLIL